MKLLLALLFIILPFASYPQAHNAGKSNVSINAVVSFITKFDMANASKDGFYLNGYVVNIGYAGAKKFNGKKIRVTGKVTIVKGLKNSKPAQVTQGRFQDTRHTESPTIEIIDG